MVGQCTWDKTKVLSHYQFCQVYDSPNFRGAYMGEIIVMWMVWIVIIASFKILHMNLKCKAILNMSIVNFLIIHIAIDINGIILQIMDEFSTNKKWTSNGLLKQ
jgi:hypothetical protein